MAASGHSRANINKAIRQEALRELLSNQKLAEKVIDIAGKLNDLSIDLEPNEVQRLKAAADINLKLVDKYLPGVKLVELTGEGGGPVDMKWTVEVVDAKPTDT